MLFVVKQITFLCLLWLLLLLLRLKVDLLGLLAKDLRGLVLHGSEDLLGERVLVKGVTDDAARVEVHIPGPLPPLELGALEAVHAHKEEKDGGDDSDESWDNEL